MKLPDKQFSLFKTCVFLLACLGVWALGMHFRLYPLTMDVTSNVKEKATLLVFANMRQSLTKQARMQHPQLSKTQLDQLVQKQVDAMMKTDKPRVMHAIEQARKNLMTQQSPAQKNPYLLASDSYYFLNNTKKILETGKVSDQFRGSKYFNDMMMAPLGQWQPINWHPHVGVLVYKTLKIFDKDIPLMHALSFTPLLLYSLAFILFILVAQTYKLSKTATIFSLIFFVLAHIFLKRSTFGWYDTDPYNLIFPLLALLLWGKTVFTFTHKKSYIYCGLLALSLSLYPLFWQGWSYIYGLMCLVGFANAIAHNLLNKRFSFNKQWKQFGIIFLGPLVGISLMFGPKEFFFILQETLGILQRFTVYELSLWPDMFMNIGELKKTNINDIAILCGGMSALIGAVIGLGWLGFRLTKKDFTLTETFIISSLFFASSIVITLGAQRFALFCLVPTTLLLGIGCQFIEQKIQIIISKLKQDKLKSIVKMSLPILIILLTTPTIAHTQKTIESLLNPIFNDTWHDALTQIDEKTPKNSIITTWWSPGHFIKAIANRRVTFDGASLESPQAYWIMRIYLSNSEEKAKGLLRMLNNSGNLATEYLHETLKWPLSKSVSLLEFLATKNEQQATTILSNQLPNKDIKHLIDLLYKNPPPSYLLFYHELISSPVLLGFIGNWNFQAIEAINNNPVQLDKLKMMDADGLNNFLWKLNGGALRVSDPLPMISKAGSNILFKENILVNPTSKNIKINSKTYGVGIPQSVFYVENDQIKQKYLTNATLPYSVLLWQKGKTPHVSLMDEKIAKSLWAKLFFFKGVGLKSFKREIHERDLSGQTEIDVYKVIY